MTNRIAASLAAVLLLAIAAPPRAGAEPFLEVIDVGVPSDGTTRMEGFRAFVLRVVSPDDPITRIDVFDSFRIAGDLHQRWIDPLGGGDYTERSPVSAADNSTPTPLNFDSHLLPPPPEATVLLADERFPRFADRVAFSPLPSTPSVGYSDPRDDRTPFGVDIGNALLTLYDLPASAGVTEVDLAYVVTDSAVLATTRVTTASGVFGGASLAAFIVVPEPAGVGTTLLIAGAFLSRRVACRLARPHRVLFETLERRRLLSAASVEALSVSPVQGTTDLILHWSDVNWEDGYRIERADGSGGWTTLADGLPPDTTSHVLPGLTGEEARLRVVAVRSASNDGPSPAAQAVVHSSDAAIRFDAMLTDDGIRLTWEALPGYSGTYKIWQKPPSGPGSDTWSLAREVSNDVRTFDAPISSNQPREYRLSTAAGSANAYAVVGRDLLPTHDRGRLLLLVDETQVDPGRSIDIIVELQRLERDLSADGWLIDTRTVPRVDVSRTNDNPNFDEYKSAVQANKSLIQSWSALDPATARTVLIFGHVAVPYSGDDADDGHTFYSPPTPDTGPNYDHRGPWAADIYYGVVDDVSWPDQDTFINVNPGDVLAENNNRPADGKFDIDDLDQLGADLDVDVAVGRVDFHLVDPRFSGVDLTPAGLDKETLRLKQYLDRNHEFRNGQWNVQRRALVDDNFDFADENNALRLGPIVGRNNVFDGEFDTRLLPSYKGPRLDGPDDDNTWLVAYGSGPGRLDSLDNVVDVADYAFSARGPHRAVFNMLFGSYVGDWDKPENILRASIADRDGLGLVATWGSRPDWFLHPMALGDPIGNSLLLTQNRGTTSLYPTDDNLEGRYSRDTQTSLLGDPTLRLHYFEPASNVLANPHKGSDAVTVTWDPSPADGVAGYHVYRADSLDGEFTRITAAPEDGFAHVDPDGGGEFVYMVRPVRLEVTPSGSYHNLATGAFSRATPSAGDFEYATQPQTISMTFSEDVGTLDDAAVTLAKRDDDPADGVDDAIALTPGVDYTVAYDPATRRAVVTLTDAVVNPINGASGVLPDGTWRLTVSRDDSGPIARDGIAEGYFAFVSLTADANNDGVVNLADFTILSNNFGTDLFGPSNGDFDYDGDVDLQDFTLLSNQMGAVLLADAGGV